MGAGQGKTMSYFPIRKRWRTVCARCWRRLTILPPLTPVLHVRRAVLPLCLRCLQKGKSSDSRSRNWRGGDSVDIDTLPSGEIKRLVEQCIVQHIDVHEWEALRRTETMEREALAQMRRSA